MNAEQIRPIVQKFGVRLLSHKTEIELLAIVATGDQAGELWARFQTEQQRRLEDRLSAARQKFLASQEWQNIETLRVRLGFMGSEAATAIRQLSEMNQRYQTELLQGDPVDMLPLLSAKRAEVENHRRAIDDFESHVKAAEQQAEHRLCAAIRDTVTQYRLDGRSRFLALVDELLSRLDTEILLELALADTAQQHNALSLPAAPGLRTQQRSDEELRHGTLPARGFEIVRDSGTPPPAAGATWGPGPAEYRDDQPEQWGPAEPQRIA